MNWDTSLEELHYHGDKDPIAMAILLNWILHGADPPLLEVFPL